MELTQLVQHLAGFPELPVLDPPVYGLPALDLAQYCLRSSELAAAALPEVLPVSASPRLLALLTHWWRPYSLAEQVVQAWRWDLISAPPLSADLPGGGPAPGSDEANRYLDLLGGGPTS